MNAVGWVAGSNGLPAIVRPTGFGPTRPGFVSAGWVGKRIDRGARGERLSVVAIQPPPCNFARPNFHVATSERILHFHFRLTARIVHLRSTL